MRLHGLSHAHLPHRPVLEQQLVEPLPALGPVEERRGLGFFHDASPILGEFQTPVVAQAPFGYGCVMRRSVSPRK
jgi:hypothetical protein